MNDTHLPLLLGDYTLALDLSHAYIIEFTNLLISVLVAFTFSYIVT